MVEVSVVDKVIHGQKGVAYVIKSEKIVLIVKLVESSIGFVSHIYASLMVRTLI